MPIRTASYKLVISSGLSIPAALMGTTLRSINLNALHYGKDNVARSATIKTLSSQLVRPFVKIAQVFDSPKRDNAAEKI